MASSAALSKRLAQVRNTIETIPKTPILDDVRGGGHERAVFWSAADPIGARGAERNALVPQAL
ncbi:hypothetical protein [Novosphingobium sp. JCM 18896]|uniref:hypothetical protein n=1 Tax=Novosphingobium sp. JCM 18896 TaxID=2989731 RepID=UPI00222233D8|nr:hypothetical protein [Novosphingobium sp. JCM 18896]